MLETPKVVVVSGHMIDTADRPSERFHPREVPRVTAEIASAFATWGVGSASTVICGGARGADIIAAEEALRRNARLVLCLALPPDKFVDQSVALPDGQWKRRFERLLDQASEIEIVNEGPGRHGDDIYSATNNRLIERALALDPHPHGILVWNGRGGDGPGGTQHFVRRLGHTGPSPKICVIDPTTRFYARRQQPGGKKKLLALDGGGIRGTLTLEILRSIEHQLGQHYGRDIVLSDFFDYIGGTSTGAIIAAALARGKKVAEVQDLYRTVARDVFRKRALPMRFRSIYRDNRLTAELDDFFGEGLTLGDSDFRSLLLIVLHNTATDSAWPLSNNTAARFNCADRYLNQNPDRNLDLPLTRLIRGSTAAPIYFAPETIAVGSADVVFQDGGLTPFNNPALLMFLMAALPEYELNWSVGQDKMLIVSVGTGSAAAVHANLRAENVHLLFNASIFPQCLCAAPP